MMLLKPVICPLSFHSAVGIGMSSLHATPSWAEIDDTLRRLEPTEERVEYDLQIIGRGKTNHKTNLRLFDANAAFKPEVTLYRDAAGKSQVCR